MSLTIALSTLTLLSGCAPDSTPPPNDVKRLSAIERTEQWQQELEQERNQALMRHRQNRDRNHD